MTQIKTVVLLFDEVPAVVYRVNVLESNR